MFVFDQQGGRLLRPQEKVFFIDRKGKSLTHHVRLQQTKASRPKDFLSPTSEAPVAYDLSNQQRLRGGLVTEASFCPADFYRRGFQGPGPRSKGKQDSTMLTKALGWNSGICVVVTMSGREAVVVNASCLQTESQVLQCVRLSDLCHIKLCLVFLGPGSRG